MTDKPRELQCSEDTSSNMAPGKTTVAFLFAFIGISCIKGTQGGTSFFGLDSKEMDDLRKNLADLDLSHSGPVTIQNGNVYQTDPNSRDKYGSINQFTQEYYSPQDHLNPYKVQSTLVLAPGGPSNKVQTTYYSSGTYEDQNGPRSFDSRQPNGSQRITNLRSSRHKRDGAPTIVYGNVDTQARNSFTIGQNASLPPGSQVIGGSILTQQRNQYLTIADSGKLVVVMPDMIQLPDPLVFLGLNDSQVDALLNITQEQHNAQIVYNLKQSLNAFKIFCERMAQTVDAHFLENQARSENNDDGYFPIDYHERMWHSTLVFHRMKSDRLERTLNRLIRKIKVGEAVTDSDVARARQDASSVLKSHKKLVVKMLEALRG